MAKDLTSGAWSASDGSCQREGPVTLTCRMETRLRRARGVRIRSSPAILPHRCSRSCTTAEDCSIVFLRLGPPGERTRARPPGPGTPNHRTSNREQGSRPDPPSSYICGSERPTRTDSTWRCPAPGVTTAARDIASPNTREIVVQAIIHHPIRGGATGRLRPG